MYNAQEKNQDINTYGPSFVNGQIRLATSYWKNNISLTIEDVKPGDGGMLRAVENSGIKVSVSASTASSLEAIIDDVIDAIKAGEDFESEAVECGVQTNNMVEISNGSNINQPKGVYLVLYKDLDSSNKAKSLRFYPFNVKSTVKGYNTSTGSGKQNKRLIQELKDFRKLMREFTKAATKAVAHSVRSESNYDRLKIFKTLSAMAAQQGINLMEDVPKNNRNNGSARTSFSPNNEMEFEFGGDLEFSAVEPFNLN